MAGNNVVDVDVSVNEHLYIQKTVSGSAVKDTVTHFHIYCMEIPFIIATEAKELASNNWHDQHGDDEYIPSSLKMQAYDMDVKFACKASANASLTVKDKINAFVRYLTGADGSGAEMKMYSTYTKIGRQGIRFKSLDENAELVKDNTGDILVFTVTFKVNDPVTDITLTL